MAETIHEQLVAIERDLERIKDTMEILLAVRIIEDGHAATMREAFVMARNPFILNKIYPVPADG